MIDEKRLIEKIKERIEIHEKDYQAFKNYSGDRKIKDIAKWDECTVIIDLIKNQPKVGNWIPCSERLPNSNGCYLVWRPHFFGGEIGMPAICYFDGQNTWHDAYGVDFTRILNESDVVAWQPLPELYKK